MSLNFDSPVRFVKGVGERRAALLQKLGIATAGQLVGFFPRAYENRAEITPVCLANQPGQTYNMLLTVRTVPRSVYLPGGRLMISFTAGDDTGQVKIYFFNTSYLKDAFRPGQIYRFRGRLSVSGNLPALASPSFENAQNELPGIVPVYPLTAGLSSKQLATAIQNALGELQFEEYLPEDIIKENNLCPYDVAMREIHLPTDEISLATARERLSFDEFFLFSLSLINLRNGSRTLTACRMKKVNLDTLLSKLPYSLTDAQKSAISDIQSDLTGASFPGNGKIPHMRRLLQGDVGSGKTIVAACAVFMAVRNGYRAALMAPTEILAQQHYADLQPLFASLGIPTALLTGSTTQAQRKKLMASLTKDTPESPWFIIGTHALLEDYVQIPSLGLIVTDEQHRFGVEQREKLAGKGGGVHALIMSATPIPRTLAIFMYGDLDISVINQLPPTRQKVDTFLVNESYRARVNAFIRKLVSQGRQAYIVCPLIEDEQGESGLKSASEYFQNLQTGALSDLRLALLHGKMRPAEKDKIMKEFASGQYDVLVSTTVIEVGVNVPNAALMIVENAERFGLSQLHQLRGRVGRGQHKSYCILISQSKAERLKFIASTNDGFEIARFDLEERGPGDFFGQRQHGDLHFMLAEGSSLKRLTEIKQQAEKLLAHDPMLQKPQNYGLRMRLGDMSYDAGKIST